MRLDTKIKNKTIKFVKTFYPEMEQKELEALVKFTIAKYYEYLLNEVDNKELSQVVNIMKKEV